MIDQDFKDTRDINGEYKGSIDNADVKRAYNKAYPSKKEVYVSKKKQEDQDRSIDYNKPSCYVVDGYNLMHYIKEFADISKSDLLTARQKTIDLLCDYKAIIGGRLIVVFDAYNESNTKQSYMYDGINIVYTKEKQLADTYIENLVPELIKDYKVTVITSDALEQALVFAHGALRMSCNEFLMIVNEKLQRDYHKYEISNPKYKNQPLKDLRDKYNENKELND